MTVEIKIEKFLNENLGKGSKKKLDKAFNVYMNIVEKIASEEFKRTLLPFLKERGWSFGTGMGAWWMGDKKKMIYAEDHPRDTELQKIAELLDMEVPGVGANSLANFMPEYKRK